MSGRSTSFVTTLALTLSFATSLIYAGPTYKRSDLSVRNHQLYERDVPYKVQDLNKQLGAARPYVRFELADTAARTAKDTVIVFDVTNCGDTKMDNNTVRAHQRVDTIEPAIRKCQTFYLQPQLSAGTNTYGIHVSDGTSPYGFVTNDNDSRAVSITTTDPLWQTSQQYQISCFTAPDDPNAKDTNGLRYFGMRCQIMVLASKKCLAANGYNDNKNATNYDLGPVDCDPKFNDLAQTWNIVNSACSFTQDNHDMSAAVTAIKPPPAC